MNKRVLTTLFVKDYRWAVKSNLAISKLVSVMTALIQGVPLDSKHKDHQLRGNMAGYRECHITPDWLLVYQVSPGVVTFVRTGSHSELFGKNRR